MGEILKKEKARLHWELNITCPHCDGEIDLLDQHNDMGEISNPIFSNRWDTLEGHDIYCSYCYKHFEIESVEY